MRLRRLLSRPLQAALRERDDARSELAAVTAQLADAQAEIAALGKTVSLKADLAALVGQDYGRLSAKLEAVRAENLQLWAEISASVEPVTAPPAAAPACACGGDTELHLRTLLVAAERRARRDRDNIVALADRLAVAEGRPLVGSDT